MTRVFGLIGGLAAALVIAALALTPPAPRGADAPAEAFSAARAMADVRAISAEPRPTGSPAAAATRDHLVRRLSDLGLETRVERASVVREREVSGRPFASGATVDNVIGLLPGRDRTAPAVVLMSHYDSVPSSPGAADDAAGVAAALEVARAILAGPPPERDLILLFTDGEELGLFGARAFFDRDPLRGRAGLVINLEARGSAGRALMFETGGRDGATVRRFAETAVRPAGTSLASFIYDVMPNDTDLSVPKEAGIQGLNFAFIGGPFDYHAPTSTPETLSQASLQDLGDQALAAVRAFLADPADPTAAPNRVWFDVFGVVVIHYGPAWGWVPLLLAGGLFAAAALRARNEGRLTRLEALRGLGAAVWIVGAGAALLTLLTRLAAGGPLASVALNARFGLFEAVLGAAALATVLFGFAALAKGRRWAAAWASLGAGAGAFLLGGFDVVAGAAGVVGAAAGFFAFARPAGPWAAWAGLTVFTMLAGLVAQLFAPTAAFLFQWAALLAAAAGAARIFAPGRWSEAAAVALGVLAAAWAFYLGHTVALGVGSGLPAAPIVLAVLAAAVLAPLIAPLAEASWAARLGTAALAAAILLTAGLRLTEPWSERTPRPTQIAHLQLEDVGAWRVSTLRELDDWTGAALRADGGAVEERLFEGVYLRPVHAAPAREVPVALPEIRLESGENGARRLILVGPPGARELRAEVRVSTPVRGARLQGRPLTLFDEARGEWRRLIWTGADEARLELTFEALGSGVAEVRLAAISDAWPQGATPLPERPADRAPWDRSDQTVAVRHARLEFAAPPPRP